MNTLEVLELLDDNESITAEEIAQQLCISRIGVWENVEKLRENGFGIELNEDGYSLESVAEYGEYGIKQYLDTDQFGEYIDFRTEVESTNELASEAAQECAPEGTVVVAEKQTGGRGRRDRDWESPEGGVYLSVVLRPDISAGEASILTLGSGVAVARSLKNLGLDPSIKWPNDVLLDEGKAAGILTELEAKPGRVNYVVVGIGLNFRGTPVVEDADADPVSIEDLLSRDLDRAEFVADLLSEFEEVYEMERQKLFEEWRSFSGTLGSDVRVELDDDVTSGRAVDIDDTGALVIETEDGERTVNSGDCHHLR
ncbi:MAG: biotin--[acetyl-CoA-carboxylase] ligase [Halobacteria archaeon]